jgi:hypothetical protein
MSWSPLSSWPVRSGVVQERDARVAASAASQPIRRRRRREDDPTRLFLLLVVLALGVILVLVILVILLLVRFFLANTVLVNRTSTLRRDVGTVQARAGKLLTRPARKRPAVTLAQCTKENGDNLALAVSGGGDTTAHDDKGGSPWADGWQVATVYKSDGDVHSRSIKPPIHYGAPFTSHKGCAGVELFASPARLQRPSAASASEYVALLLFNPSKSGKAGVEVFFKGERLQGSFTSTPLPPQSEVRTEAHPDYAQLGHDHQDHPRRLQSAVYVTCVRSCY